MQTITVPFYGNELYVVDHNGEAYTPMKPIVEGMGLDWKSQRTKIKQRFTKGGVEITIPTAGGPQKMLCLALRKLNGWLQTKSSLRFVTELFSIRVNVMMFSMITGQRGMPLIHAAPV